MERSKLSEVLISAVQWLPLGGGRNRSKSFEIDTNSLKVSLWETSKGAPS